MKYIFLITTLLAILSCITGCTVKVNPEDLPEYKPDTTLPVEMITYTIPQTSHATYLEVPTVTVVTIDSCQYLVGCSNGVDGGPVLTHKGNCNNLIHITNSYEK